MSGRYFYNFPNGDEVCNIFSGRTGTCALKPHSFFFFKPEEWVTTLIEHCSAFAFVNMGITAGVGIYLWGNKIHDLLKQF